MKKYLLVDDNNFSLSLIEELINQMSDDKDISFVLVNDAKEAVKVFGESKPEEFSAIFLDIVMPEKSGLVILREIRAMERSDAKKVPIIIVSALAESNSISDPKDKELITDYVQKPLSVEKIRNALERLK